MLTCTQLITTSGCRFKKPRWIHQDFFFSFQNGAGAWRIACDRKLYSRNGIRPRDTDGHRITHPTLSEKVVLYSIIPDRQPNHFNR